MLSSVRMVSVLLLLAPYQVLATPLQPAEQAVLANSIQQYCQAQLVKTPQFVQASAKYGRDIGGPYCNCLASKTAGNLTRENMMSAARSDTPQYAALQRSIAQYAGECLQAQGITGGM